MFANCGLAIYIRRASWASDISEHYEKADEGEIRGSSQPLEMGQVPEQRDPFNAAEAIQEPQVLPQTLEQVKGPKQSDTENRTSLQEAPSPPSDVTIHMSSISDLAEGPNQRQIATSIPREHDQSCTPKDCHQTQGPYSATLVSIPAAITPSSEDLDRPKPSEPSSISLTLEDTAMSILTGERNSDEPHIQSLVLGGMALSRENQYSADVVINQRPKHQPSKLAEAHSSSLGASYEHFFWI